MNSTELKHKELLAAEFFNDVIVPLALNERAAGKSFFPLGPDPEMKSYYVEPARSIMEASDFELRGAESIVDFVDALAELWIAEGNDELASMAPRLQELAEALGEQETQAEDVSAFMYVMF